MPAPVSLLPLLSAVLTERNTVLAVPDCCDQEILARKDAYGTLDGDAWLTRGAAAAMLSRVIDPAQRLTIDLMPLELCRGLLEIDPAAVLMTVVGRQITADQFMPTLTETLFEYNHSHFASIGLEISGKTEADMALARIAVFIR